MPEQEPPRIGTRFEYRVGTDRKVVLDEDTAGGCGGKAWEAAVMLSDYLQERCAKPGAMEPYKRVLELGSGTGFVGIVAASLASSPANWTPNVDITDLDIFVPLISHNVDLNLTGDERDRVSAKALHWGDPLSDDIRSKLPYDLILLADCVYLESLFDILVSSLCDLTEHELQNEPPEGAKKTEIWIAYKKRRKADKRFWTKLGKKFEYKEVTDFAAMEGFKKGSLYLYRVTRVR